MDKREKLTKKLKDALDEDKTLQGDLGIQEVEEVLLFLLDDTAPKENIIPEESKISSGSREAKSNPEFKRNEDAVRETRRENQVKGDKPMITSPGETDKTDNADSSLGRMNETDPDTLKLHSKGDTVEADKVFKETKKDK